VENFRFPQSANPKNNSQEKPSLEGKNGNPKTYDA
jgi:hypothetical protein